MIALALLLAIQDGPLPVQKKLNQIDRTFVCPESLPSDAAREDALRLFIAQVQAAEPNLTVQALTEYRISLLEKHQCRDTLAKLRKSQ